VSEGYEAELIQQRIEHLDELTKLENGTRYPNDFQPSCRIGEALAIANEHEDIGSQEIHVQVAGRAISKNSFGKAVFIKLRDQTGTIQAYFRQNDLPELLFSRLKLTDIGDIVGVAGTLFRTRTGEITVKVSDYRVLSKSQRPLPEKWHGLKDQELRQRMRYVDLIVNEESRQVFITRSKIIKYIRDFMDSRGFMEVETPMMHPVLGGANARPFKTHHNALDMSLYLRIAPELYLKRLVVGGFDRVYEINRNFRNEGISNRHNPEFTMIEFYWAYATYLDLMDLTEELFRGLVKDIVGAETVTFRGHEIDFAPSFRRLSVLDGLRQYAGYEEADFNDPVRAAKKARQYRVPKEVIETIQKTHAGGNDRDHALELAMHVFEEVVEPHLIQPTFVTDFPAVVSPLSRRKDSDPSLVDRFEFYIANAEFGNAFSELNDPQDQAQRFRDQLAAKAAGDAEAMEFDEDYIRALEYGLPPTAGEGLGIDRIVMLLTSRDNIRDVILFPLLRPEG
jgi:lysyl-tRNA synthetase class 2